MGSGWSNLAHIIGLTIRLVNNFFLNRAKTLIGRAWRDFCFPRIRIAQARKVCHARVMGIMRIAIAGLLLVALAACGRTQVIREPVTVVRVVYVPISPTLTRQHPVAEPRNDTGKELLRVARARKASLHTCNASLEEIAGLQGTQVP